MADSYALLVERLENPQPSMQRFAVIAIFEKFKTAPAHLSLQSPAGNEALFRCLHSSHAAVIDQAIRELCSLVEGGDVNMVMEPPRAFQELQAALDAAPLHSVETITKAIGYLSRLLYKRRSPYFSAIFSSSSPEQHPFVKVFLSREEAHAELLQQTILFAAEINFANSADFASSLRPLLIYTAVQISISTRHTFFVQRLYSHLVSLSCSYLSQGLSIFKNLVECIKYFPQQTAEEIGVTVALAEELVDALKVILSKSSGQAKPARLCGLELSEHLISLCNNLSERGLGCSSVLLLLKHSMVVQMDKDWEYFCEFDSILIALAHMLVTMEYEHEQLLLLNLAIASLEWKRKSRLCLSEKSMVDFPVEVLFIFPVIHVMSSPSKTLKKTANCLLHILERKLDELQIGPSSLSKIYQRGLNDGHKLGTFMHQLLNCIWSQDQGLITWNCDSDSAYEWLSKLLGSSNKSKSWLKNLQITSLQTGGGSKRLSVSQTYGTVSKGLVLILSMVLSALVLHPTLGSCALKALTAISRIEQSLGASFLLVVLFYLNLLRKHGCKSQELVLELLGVLPGLACHSVTVPLILQTIQQMLCRDAPLELRATAIRLLCKTWENSDHVFMHLQKFLDPKILSNSTLETDLAISMGACVHDVCKKDADRGVDLILSIQACIESKNMTVQAFGLESLAHLCESDVIDFYTAWAVVSKHLQDPLSDPIIANSLCILLRWGAMDAETYPQASKKILELIWEVATLKDTEYSDLWEKARISAVHGLTFYEVDYIQQNISGFPGKHVDLLVSENSPKVQQVMEGLVAKFLMHEHSTRRRVRKQERVATSKVEKYLYALPQILFTAEGKTSIRDIPGAALLCLRFSPPSRTGAKKDSLRDLQKLQAKYKDALVDIAESIQLTRNIFLAFLSLQSWFPFMRQWLKAKFIVLEAEGMCDAQEQITIRAAESIYKDIKNIAEEVVPRTAENLALAVGAFCMILPSSAHGLIPAASKFLLDWLYQDAHEYKQWSSAISIGLVSTCLHTTDWKYRCEITSGLLKVAGRSHRALVIGACGVGLGFACHGLFSCGSVSNASFKEIGAGKQKEAELLGQIVKSLTQLLCRICPSATESLQNLYQFDILNKGDSDFVYKLPDMATKQRDNLEENIWGIAGLVIGLGTSVVAIQKYESPLMVVEITNVLISWIPFVHSWQRQGIQSECFAYNNVSAVSLAVGSCLALPTAVNVSHKLELMNEGLDYLVNGFRILISESASQKERGYLHQNLLLASCVGSGNLLSSILNESAYPIPVEDIKQLLETMRRIYIEPNPPIVHFGGMIGVVNALGASGGLINPFNKVVDLQPRTCQKEQGTSYVRGPILSNPYCEQLSLPLIQEMLGVVRNSDDIQLRHSAGWALSFLHDAYFIGDQSFHQTGNGVHTDDSSYGSTISLQSFPEDSTVWCLCSVLLDLTGSETGSNAPAKTIVSVLRCLEKAPRLPSIDWGGLIRGIMRYKDLISWNQQLPVSHNHIFIHASQVREECIHFSFVHAGHILSLLNFLDDLCELSRFKLLEHSLQCVLLLHMVDMMKVFSQSRMEKLLSDIMDFFSRQLVLDVLDQDIEKDRGLKRSLRITFWKGLHKCLTESLLLSSESYSSYITNCMQSLLGLLPSVPYSFSEMRNTGNKVLDDEEEWSQAIKCLTNAPKEWVLSILQVKVKDFAETETSSVTMKRVIFARAKLVANNYMPHSELGKARSYLLNKKSDDIWRLLIEVAMALRHTTNDVKRQWLHDTVEASCITKYPSTALRFLGLLTSSWSPYAVCLSLDPVSVLQELPFTFSSLFLDSSWSPILGSVIPKLLCLIERIRNWQSSSEINGHIEVMDSIEKDEKQVSSLLLDILKQMCLALKGRLSFDVQLKLANIIT